MFFLGLYTLKKNSPYTPILLILYGSHVTTTVIPVLTTTLATPIFTSAADAASFTSLNASQLTVLMASYIPFLAVPLAMTVDGTRRMIRIVAHSREMEKLSKQS